MIAIACLKGPLAAAGAGLAEVVKYAQARYEADTDARDLRRSLTKGIQQWASGERLSAKNIDLGLAPSADVVALFGLDINQIADVNFDPEQAAAIVIRKARVADANYWGAETPYESALQALEEGATLSHVELPLFTTWDQWTKFRDGGTRVSLIAASLSAGLGHSDPGDSETIERLKRANYRS